MADETKVLQDQVADLTSKLEAAGKNGKFTQEDIDRVVKDRLGREQSKYTDYDDLKKFKDDHAKNEDAQKEKDLESQKNYDELKKGWVEKENNFNKALLEKDGAFKSLKIDNAWAQK